MRKITYIGLLSIMLCLNLAFTSPPLPPESPFPTPTPSGWWQGHPVITPDNAGALEEVYRYGAPRPIFFTHSPDYRVIVGQYEDGLHFYDRSSGRLLAVLEDVYANSSSSLSVSRNAARVALFTTEGETFVYQRFGGAFLEVYHSQAPETEIFFDHPIALSPDGQWLAESSNELRIINVETGEQVYSNNALSGNLAFSPDGKWLAIAFLDGVTILSTSDIHRAPVQIMAPADNISFAFSGDSQYLAISTADQVHVWKLAERRDIRYISLPLNNGYDLPWPWEVSMPVSDVLVAVGFPGDRIAQVAYARRISDGQTLPLPSEPPSFAIPVPSEDGWRWWLPPEGFGDESGWLPEWLLWEDGALVWNGREGACRLRFGDSWDCEATGRYQVVYREERDDWIVNMENGISARLPYLRQGSVAIRWEGQTLTRVSGWMYPRPNNIRLVGRFVALLVDRSSPVGDKYIQSLMIFDPEEKRFVYQWDMAAPNAPEWWQEKHLARPCDQFGTDQEGRIYISASVEDENKGRYTEIRRVASFDAAPQIVAEIPVYGCLSAVSPDVSLFVVSDYTGKAFLVDARGKTLQRWQKADAFAFSPDGRFLAGLQGGYLKIWAVSTDEPLRKGDWRLPRQIRTY